MATPLETLVLGETGLVAFYLLNETTGTTATDSKGSNNGTYQNGGAGGYTLNTTGIITSDANNCPTFVNVHDGCVTIPTGIAPGATSAFTWEAWVDPTSGTIGNMRVLGHDDGSTNGPSFMYDKPNNQWHAWRSSSSTQLSFSAGAINTVYHVAITYDGRVLRGYVNGQSRGGIIDTTSISTVGSNFIIGANGGFGNSWNGKIQYVAIYSVALTGSQIKKHYRQGINSLLTANNTHSYGAYINTGLSWDANPPSNYGELDTWTNEATDNGLTSHKPGLFHCFKNWANDAHFPLALAQQANQSPRGADLMVTWEAWDPGASGTGGHKADQPIYALQNIVNGNFDAYITVWANDIKSYGLPVFLRLFHEYNGDYYPWGIVLDANNNSQSDYVTVNTEALVASAWQHVHGIFATVGVTNVKWVFCPNIFVDTFSYHPVTSTSYPGDSYVDYIGLDGYQTSSNSSTNIWLSFFDLYSQAYDTLTTITSKPMIVPEVACTEDSTAFYTKAGWINQALGTDIPNSFPAIQIFSWEDDVNYPPGNNTSPINSSTAALSAFQTQIASSQYANGTPLALPTPTLTSVSPTTAVVNTSFTLTATGTNFNSQSVINWGSTALTTTLVSSTSLTATIPASMTATTGTYSVTVATPGFATTSGQNVTINNPAPTLSSISPSSAVATGPAFTLTATGTGYVAGAVIKWAGTSLTTTVVSGTQLTATVPSTDIASAGSTTITVANPGTADSSGQTFTVTAAPTLISISPTSALVNSVLTLTATGTNFQSNSTINWAGTPLTTAFVSSTQLTATVGTSQTGAIGTYAITVATPTLAITSSQNFTVNNPVPQLSSLAPNTTTTGNRTVPLTVNGSGFVSGATMLWNGVAISTSFVSSIQLTANIPGTDLLSAGTATITATNPSTAASNGLTFTVTNTPPVVPVLTSLSPGSVVLGSAQFTLTVNGSQLASGAVVTWTFLGVATALATTFVSAAQVTAIVPASLVTTQGSATITATNPGSAASGGLTFLVNAPAMATLRVTIGGVDVSNYVDVRSMNIQQVLTRRGDTATFNIHDYTLGMSFQLLATVVIVDSVGNTMFSGPLTTLERDPVSPTETLFVMGAQDWTYYLSKTLVNKKYTDMTVDAIVKDLLASFPPGVAITTNNVQANLPLLAYISFPHVRLSDAFDKLVRFSSSLSTLMWDIDPYKDLHFFDANHVPEADVQLVDTLPTAGQAGYARDTFKYIEDGSQLANQITFRGATYLSNPPHQQTWVGNGEQASFPLDYVPDTNENAGGSLPSVTVMGVSQSVALDVGTGFGSNQVLTTVGINNMAVLQFAVPPAAGAVITAAYVFDLPVIVRTKDNISVTSFGIWEEYITDDTVATTQSAVQRAGAMLSQFSRPLATAQVDVALNYVGTLAAGQQLLLVCQQLSVSRQMVVTDCNIVGRAGSKYQYKLKLAAFD